MAKLNAFELMGACSFLLIACAEDRSRVCGATEGLVLHYDFESRLEDRSGFERHGQASGGMAYEDGPVGQALGFDGTQSVTVTDGRELGLVAGQTRTITFWARLDEFGDGTVGRQIINQYRHLFVEESSFFVAMGPGGKVGVSGQGTDVLEAPESTTGQWHHWGVVLSAGDDATVIYRDGVELARGKVTYSPGQSPRDVVIGALPELEGSNFVGAIDELRIYDRILSATEVQAIARCQN